MKTNSQLRQESLSAIKGSWLSIACIVFIAMLLSCAFQLGDIFKFFTAPMSSLAQGYNWHSSATWIVSLFLVVPITYSVFLACMGMLRCERERVRVSDMFCAFGGGRYLKVVLMGFLVGIFTLLWALLLIVPGIIKGLSYSMAPYILLENPDMSVMDAIDESQEMMKGHKMDLFLMKLGEFGFVMLSIFTLCIASFWIEGYYYTVYADFYLSLKADEPSDQPIID